MGCRGSLRVPRGFPDFFKIFLNFTWGGRGAHQKEGWERRTVRVRRKVGKYWLMSFGGKKDIVLAGMIDKYFVGQRIFSFFNPIFLFSLSLSLSRSLSLSLSRFLSRISLSLSFRVTYFFVLV